MAQPQPGHGTPPSEIATLNTPVERQSYSNMGCDGETLNQKSIRISRFERIGFIASKIHGCHFNHGMFVDCTFRDADFRQTSLVGCRFIRCNFHGATFDSTNLEYALFDDCDLDYRQVRHCLPTKVNLLWLLARNLRVNAQRRGDSADARRFLVVELRAAESHNFKKFTDYSDPLYEKYPWHERVQGFREWLRLLASKTFWGYGERPSRVILLGIFVIFFSAMLLWGAPWFRIGNAASNTSFVKYVAFTAASFATTSYGNFVADNFATRVFTTIEGCFGVIFFGYLVTVIYRRVTER